MADRKDKTNSKCRIAPAPRTRLRSGQLLDLNEVPISDCTLYDLENDGVGVIVPDPDIEIPNSIYIQDNKDLMMVLAQVQWCMGPNLGVAYLGKPVPLSIWAKSKEQQKQVS